MIALLVALTFVVAVLVDHLVNRQPLVLKESGAGAPAPRPRLVPNVVAGFALPDNLRYHPGHTWALSESPELVRIGIDDFAAKVAGEVKTIDVPERGQWIRQGQRIIAMHHDGRELSLVSPIEGTVVSVNDAALKDPTLARTDPYGDGWLLTVNAPDTITNFRNLLSGSVARRWMDDAAFRLRALSLPHVPVMQDGGIAVDNVIDQLPAHDWDKLNEELFLG